MLAVLTGSADGVPHDDEIDAVQWRLAPQLVRLGADGRRRALEILTELVDRNGLPATLETLRDAIAKDKHDEAFRLVLEVAWADRRMTESELRHVTQVGSLLGVLPGRVEQLVRERAP